MLSKYIEWLFDHLTPAQIDDPADDPDLDRIKDLLEYVVDFDPAVPNIEHCHSLRYDATSAVGRVTVPIRPDLDPDVSVDVLTRTSLTSGLWSTSGVQRSGNVFSAGTAGDRQRYFTTRAERSVPASSCSRC